MTRLCVPVSGNNAIWLTVLLEAHDAYMHQGVDKTYRRLHAGYYWPTMTKDVQRYVNSCESCRRMKSKTHAEMGAISGHHSGRYPINDGTFYIWTSLRTYSPRKRGSIVFWCVPTICRCIRI